MSKRVTAGERGRGGERMKGRKGRKGRTGREVAGLRETEFGGGGGLVC